MKRSAPLWVFPLALFPLGLGFFLLGGREVRVGHESLRWTPVIGVVQSARLARNFPVPAQPAITYRYSFEGQSYVSNRVWPGDVAALMPLMSAGASARVVERFPEGQPVTVYVDPRHPAQSALLPGAGRAARWMTIFSIFFAASFWGPLSVARWVRPNSQPNGPYS